MQIGHNHSETDPGHDWRGDICTTPGGSYHPRACQALRFSWPPISAGLDHHDPGSGQFHAGLGMTALCLSISGIHHAHYGIRAQQGGGLVGLRITWQTIFFALLGPPKGQGIVLKTRMRCSPRGVAAAALPTQWKRHCINLVKWIHAAAS